MRVLFWLATFLPDMGGIQTLCADLVPAMMDRGHEVLLLTAHTNIAMPDHSMHGRIEVRRVDSLRALHQQDPGQILRSKKEISRIVTDFEPDLIHLHPCGPESGYFHQMQRNKRIPTLLTLHNNYSEVGIDFGETASFGRAFGFAQRIATVSDDARRWLLSIRPDLASRTSTVHNGIPATHTAASLLPWDPPRLVYVGRVEAQKRLDVLVRAFVDVAATHATVRLQIVGDGTQRRDLMAMAESLGVADRVDFSGRVEPESIVDILDRSTIFVMSSDFEGLPIALLEAARHGRPTVATNVGGIPEVVLPGETGVVVEPDDAPALARAISSLLDDRQRAQRLGNEARRHFDAAFSLDACATAYDRLYDDVIMAAAETNDAASP